MSVLSEYTLRLRELTMSAPWDVELPVDWFERIHQIGEAPRVENDDRMSQRSTTQSPALMWFESSYIPRGSRPHGIYTRDFSDFGASFLSALKVFVGERVRIAMPSQWMRLKIVRADRVSCRCFEIGAEIVSRHDPSLEALESPVPNEQIPPHTWVPNLVGVVESS